MKPSKLNSFGVMSLGGGLLAVAAAVGVAQQELRTPAPTPGVAQAEALSVTFREVAKAVLPAVVSIETRAKAIQINQPGGGGRSPMQDEFFKKFFGDQLPEGFGDQLPEGFGDQFRQFRSPEQRGSGSGFIIDESGVILTNAHVLSGADRVVVKLEDGRELTATEWHVDPRSDVAIVRVDAGGPLPYVPLGDSNTMEIGDWVLALGNPFDIGTTVTSGIISAKGRSAGVNERENYLQTDAAINPGNSGGPLVNIQGEVVGINTAISTRSGGYDGVGFAIPVNSARWVADQLMATGAVKRAYLGVQLQQLTPELRERFGVPTGQGALVNFVYEDAPAGKAGLQAGDVILKFAGQDVQHSAHLQGVVEQLVVNKSYPMTVLRDGEHTELNVELKEMPGDFTPAMQRFSKPQSDDSPKAEAFNELGMEMGSVQDDAAKAFELSDDVKGAVVLSVEPESHAAKVGIRPGDVIEKVGNQSIKSPEDFNKAIDGVTVEDGIVMLVRRGESTHFVVVGADN